VLSKSVTFLDFLLSQDSVATDCRWGGHLCNVYIENFLTNHLVKEFWKSVLICRKKHGISKCTFLLGHRVSRVESLSTAIVPDSLDWKHMED